MQWLSCSVLPTLASLLIGGQVAALALPSASSLSLAQASSAIEAGGAGVGNSLVANALAYLAANQATLQEALASLPAGSTLSGVGGDPELKFYGLSPPVYPSPQGSGAGDWAQAYKQARNLVSQMTNDEKNNITYGLQLANGCSGLTGSVPRLGFNGICLNDAESGVRTGNLVNGYPAQLHIGASWNRSLALARAQLLGREFKAKGISVALGPVVGPLGRLAKGGRNWEGFSNDPYLAGSLVAPTVSGLQESVIACVKHFIANEQETNRVPFLLGLVMDVGIQAVSSNVDDKTMHENYLWPFYDAVKAGAGSVMCSYNRVNNSYSCQNSKMMNGLLKNELGFQGFVVSDWTAQHSGVASANAGLDMAMPISQYWMLDTLATAVSNGSMSSSRLDDMATRILASWFKYSPITVPGMDPYADVDARDPGAEAILIQGAAEGHVLVKNINNALPLKSPRVLSLFGYDGVSGTNTSGTDSTAYNVGLANTNKYDDGTPFSVDAGAGLYTIDAVPYGTAGPQLAIGGTMITGGGSGAITPSRMISPYDAFLTQAGIDKTVLFTDFTSQNPTVNSASDACIVMVNEQSSETWDRAGLADAYADQLVQNVASQCSNTIVVIHNAGIRLVDAWIESPNITAVMYAHLPGQYSGAGLIEVLYGRQSPSGRLPYTVGQSEADYGSLLNPTAPDESNPQFPQSNFDEGGFLDYKHFIQNSITPRYPFGYGLTYTNFTYSSLKILKTSGVSTSPLPPDRLTGTSQTAPEGGLASLYDIIATVTAVVRNVGKVTAAEVGQLYLGVPNGLPKVLRGFDKHLIQSGQSAMFTFPLRRRDLSQWDSQQQQWVMPAGTYDIMVGKSVLDIQLTGTFRL